ncbi:hypothetical protein GCM10027060_00450 [Nesterenkonia halophila]
MRPAARVSRRRRPADPHAARGPGASSVREERGAATAEFTMVAALLALLFVLTLQLAVVVHVRNTLIDAASTGARFGALDDRSAADGVARTEELISGAIGVDHAEHVGHRWRSVDAGRELTIVVEADVPLFGLGPGLGHLEVSGSAVEFE